MQFYPALPVCASQAAQIHTTIGKMITQIASSQPMAFPDFKRELSHTLE
jgi:hypothetical protein